MSLFNTKGNQEFGEDYSKKAHHQASFNEVIIANLSEAISSWFNTSDGHPIKIVDLCCGHGKPTHDLLLALEARGVSVEKIIGYDISESQVSTARSNYSTEKLEFYTQDVSTLVDGSKYDIAISLFGLHWMENINTTAKAISHILKPDEKVMFFVPLEKMDLFQLRQNLVSSAKWGESFKEFKLNPFIASENLYILAFDRHFAHDDASTHRGSREITYTRDQFISFLSSWMQEVRHLKVTSSNHEEYLRDLLDTFPSEGEGNVRKLDGDNFLFREHFFEYRGQMLEADNAVLQPAMAGYDVTGASLVDSTFLA